MPPTNFITLSALASLVTDVIADSFEGKAFWVVGDITSHSFKPRENRHFFVLAEKAAEGNSLVARIDAVAWKNTAEKITHFEQITGCTFGSSLQVLVKVSVSFNAAFGLKLTLLDIDATYTLGALEQEKQSILRRLETECAEYITRSGDIYITRNNQLQLQPVIQKIALIASANTAGYEDFMHILEHNQYGYRFSVDPYFTSVQGDNNSHLLRKTLVAIYTSGKPYHAVAIIRGGGAQTDFLIFDNFGIGQAVAKFPIPVITGIGHQRNETIADLMAHTATNTPTKAAEYIVAHNLQFEQQVLSAQEHIREAALSLTRFRTQQLAPVIANIKNYSAIYLHRQDSLLARYAATTQAVSPANVLKKGFAWIRKQGSTLNAAAPPVPGDTVEISMTNMELSATITKVILKDGNHTDL
jgi:exodeoxyribonuclease VII large subunit